MTVGQLGFGPVVERVGYPVSFVVMGVVVFTGVPILLRREEPRGHNVALGVATERKP